MARDWTDLFITDGATAGTATAVEEEPERRRGFFRRLRENLSKTRSALSAEVQATLLSGDVDEETWERLEEALIMADVGAATTARVVAQLEQEASDGGLEGGDALSGRLVELLADIARPAEDGADRIDLRREPTVIMAVGVNGTGKTTTIGKLAWHLQRELGQTVLLGAADTFRAAAVEQLTGGPSGPAARSSSPTARAPTPAPSRSRPSRRGREQGVDVVIIDTAGRLHTQDDAHGRAGEDPPGRRQAAARRAARDAADRRLHDGPERPAAGEAVLARSSPSTASCSRSSTAPRRAASRWRSPASWASR